MTKLQTKTQNLTLKIQKLARVLNKFTISDVQQILSISDRTVNNILEILINENIIKKISKTEYLYIKMRELQNSQIENNVEVQNLISMEEAMFLTRQKRETIRRKCKNRTYESIFELNGKNKIYKINYNSILKDIKTCRFRPIDFEIQKTSIPIQENEEDNNKKALLMTFKNEEEQRIYDNASDFQKKYVAKYMTILKLAGNLKGNNLVNFLKGLGEKYPEYKSSYTTIACIKNKYLKYGLEGILPKYGSVNKNKCIIPKDMYEDFKKIYLKNKKYSLAYSVKCLEKLGYNADIIPSTKTFERLLYKEYSRECVKKIREVEFTVSNINLRLDESEPNKNTQPVPQFEKYIDAANAYIKKYKNDKSNNQICRRGYIKNHLNPFFKTYYFSDITNDTIKEYVQYTLSQGYAMASIKRFLAALSCVMTEYNIPNNIILSASNLPLMNEQCNFLNEDEIKTIIKKQDESLWILCLGINPAELEALEYSDIDYKNKVVKIDKCIFNNKVEKYRKLYKIRSLKIPKILFKSLLKNNKGRIFNTINIENFEILLNTHVKLLLDKNIQINIISKNLGFQKLTDFEKRFQNLLPQKLNDDFEIL